MDKHRKALMLPALMGVLTILLCLVVADGIIGLNQSPAHRSTGIMANAFLWGGLIGLPLLFYKWVQWKYTLLNFPLYFLLYFPVYAMFGLKHTHYFLGTGGFIDFPTCWGALLVAVWFWGVQSLAYLICNLLCHIIQKQKEKRSK